MIETLLFLTCLNSSDVACSSAASAYYDYSGIQSAVTQKEKVIASENPNLSRLALVMAAAYQGQATIALTANKSLTINTKTSTIGIGVAF